MQWIRDITPDAGRQRLYRRAMLITLLGNLTLALGKSAAAYYSHSVALYADAANSVSDVLYSLLMVLGLWMAMRPPDLSHPQGHSRFEPLVGLMVTLAMAYAGYEAGRAAIERFLMGGSAVEPGLPTLVLLASAALKAGMYFAIRRIAAAVASPTLAITARDNLSDVLTSIAAFIGVFGSHYVYPLLDAIAGALVALWIFRAAFAAGRENLKYLTGAGASRELRQELAATAAAVPGVLRVHQVLTEYIGSQLVADLHINVDGGINLHEAHQIADAVQAAVEAVEGIDRAYVHVEPCEAPSGSPASA
ncbi:MAG TPA: cation diffusion facilitator family transporter [Anaerolineae bacterium]|nr:cation diffusion facilitator family transporter [Anaerolineae bacterium]